MLGLRVHVKEFDLRYRNTEPTYYLPMPVASCWLRVRVTASVVRRVQTLCQKLAVLGPRPASSRYGFGFRVSGPGL